MSQNTDKSGFSQRPNLGDRTYSIIDVSKEEKNFSLLAHILGLFTGIVGPLILWIIKKDTSSFIEKHTREALNFQITLLFAYVVSWILSFALIGFFILPIVFILSLIFSVSAAVKASNGIEYIYPLTIRLVK